MKLLHLLSLAPFCSAFVIPDAETLNSLSEKDYEASHSVLEDTAESLPCPHEIWRSLEDKLHGLKEDAEATFDSAVDYTFDTAVEAGEKAQDIFNTQQESWFNGLEDAEKVVEEADFFTRPDHGKPKHPPHHGKPNQTVFELIAGSKYTTKLASLISDYPDLVEALNGTAANYTVFAPTDRAFAKIPSHAPKPSKEQLKTILSYHVSPDFYPAGRVLVSRTIPTIYTEEALGSKPQRLATQISFKGLTVNFYSRIVAINIFGTNGVIHGVDSLLLPPPKVIDIIQFLPTQFSTLELALNKTGLDLSDTSTHAGGTIFAPSNGAFAKLGPKITAFLFSSYGLKYLKALLLYHVVPNITLYSDAIYKASPPSSDISTETLPKGHYHIDLPTALEDRTLSIDIGRLGRLIDIRVNGYTSVAVQDGAARDGVIQVVSSVLVPPKKLAEGEEQKSVALEDIEDVEELMERLEPLVQKDSGKSWRIDL
ncbi:MAG: hypothetical protein Q9160_000341 [Pyrenula sp. 1 TL-2023]